MEKPTFEELLEAGVHLGHLKKKWNPLMSQYIFGVRNGIHVIDLHKTLIKLDEACAALKQMTKSGKKILFVATKKQAQEIIKNKIGALNMPYITERWSGGMLTNFATIRRSIKKMQTLDKMFKDGTTETMSKRERLQLQRQKEKMEKLFGSIVDMTKVPSAIFVIDLKKEIIAIREARKLGIPVFGIVDTNANPNEVDFAIPANDDATTSIEKIMDIIAKSMAEGMAEKKSSSNKENETGESNEEIAEKTEDPKNLRSRRKKVEEKIKPEETTEA